MFYIYVCMDGCILYVDVYSRGGFLLMLYQLFIIKRFFFFSFSFFLTF